MDHLLIIGASRGLGLALVAEALGSDCRVTAVVRGRAPLLDPFEHLHGSRLVILTADVRSEAALAAAASQLDQHPKVDTLVYNAAIHLERDRSDLTIANPDDILEMLDTNAVGALRSVKHFGRSLARDAQVVLISSEAGSIADAGRQSEYGYCMSKAALNMFAKLLANRERGRGSQIQIHSVHPGWMRTDMGGPNAHISAEEAAVAIMKTLRSCKGKPCPIFIDRLGEPLAW